MPARPPRRPTRACSARAAPRPRASLRAASCGRPSFLPTFIRRASAQPPVGERHESGCPPIHLPQPITIAVRPGTARRRTRPGRHQDGCRAGRRRWSPARTGELLPDPGSRRSCRHARRHQRPDHEGRRGGNAPGARQCRTDHGGRDRYRRRRRRRAGSHPVGHRRHHRMGRHAGRRRCSGAARRPGPG